nr:hypothetical protein [Nocardia acidivorans]
MLWHQSDSEIARLRREFVEVPDDVPLVEADGLYPLAIGRATLAVCRAAFDHRVVSADSDLTVYLDLAIRALGDGLATPPPAPARS